jgi:hypothetical protein
MHESRHGTQVTMWERIPAGENLFVALPGLGEHVHTCTADVAPATQPYEIRVAAPAVGKVQFTLRGDASVDGGRVVVVHLRAEAGTSEPPFEYRIAVRRQDAAAGWTAQQMLPGRYRCVVTDRGIDAPTTVLTIAADTTTTLAID